MKPNLEIKLLTVAVAWLLAAPTYAGAGFGGHGHSRATLGYVSAAPVHVYAGSHRDRHRHHGFRREHHHGRSRGHFTTRVPRPAYYFSYYQPYAYVPAPYYPPLPYPGYGRAYYGGVPAYRNGLYFSFSFWD